MVSDDTLRSHARGDCEFADICRELLARRHPWRMGSEPPDRGMLVVYDTRGDMQDAHVVYYRDGEWDMPGIGTLRNPPAFWCEIPERKP